uniref:Uncharacterized protein n=1 Tax=Arundo donax TaxID=35708 RepID=A0A0A9CQA4_ARUDO
MLSHSSVDLQTSRTSCAPLLFVMYFCKKMIYHILFLHPSSTISLVEVCVQLNIFVIYGFPYFHGESDSIFLFLARSTQMFRGYNFCS